MLFWPILGLNPFPSYYAQNSESMCCVLYATKSISDENWEGLCETEKVKMDLKDTGKKS